MGCHCSKQANDVIEVDIERRKIPKEGISVENGSLKCPIETSEADLESVDSPEKSGNFNHNHHDPVDIIDVSNLHVESLSVNFLENNNDATSTEGTSQRSSSTSSIKSTDDHKINNDSTNELSNQEKFRSPGNQVEETEEYIFGKPKPSNVAYEDVVINSRYTRELQKYEVEIIRKYEEEKLLANGRWKRELEEAKNLKKNGNVYFNGSMALPHLDNQ